jgi:hypothetical protein
MDDKSFLVNSRMKNAWLCSDDIDRVQFIGMYNMDRPIDFSISKKITHIKWPIIDFSRPNNLQWKENNLKYEP